MRAGDIWEIFVPFAQFCHKPKSVLPKKKKKRLVRFFKRGDNACIIKVNSFDYLSMGGKFYVPPSTKKSQGVPF